jgi:Rrf2 family protein
VTIVRMSERVEWGLHCCITLAWLGNDEPVSTARFAAEFDLPTAYLNKCLQALVRADILTSTAGARGGFRLAKAPNRITLLDVVTAIEGPAEAFRCMEIRRRGIGARVAAREFRAPCAIAAAMLRAERAWRKELSTQTLADIAATAPAAAMQRTRCWHERERA